MISDRPIIVAIQGGVGSFNHAAALEHLPAILGGQDRWRIEFVHTATNVFAALNEGSAQFGQFAFWNSTAGPYVDCVNEFARNICEIAAWYKMPIQHCLLHAKSTDIRQLTRVITHRDVLKQCGQTLQSRYPHVSVEVGSDSFEDPSNIAEAIATGALPPDVATVSNGLLAKHFHLEIGDAELADASNESTFLLVKGIQ